MIQGDLWSDFDESRPRTIQERFERFHADNPCVYEGLVRLARIAVRMKRTKLGIGQLYEVLRWNLWMETFERFGEVTLANGESIEVKLSNAYRSRYARLIMEQEPDLKGIFETRVLTAP